jgi:Zn finger protein HypA/HybF involved in hydrogenase expression
MEIAIFRSLNDLCEHLVVIMGFVNLFFNVNKCYLCGGELSKIENTTTAFAVQMGERSGDPRLAKKANFRSILKPHLRCEKCGIIICKGCRPSRKTVKIWQNWPNCPKCESKMVYI